MRPSVTGEISPKAAAAFTAIFAAGFCACAYFINLACFYLSFPALAVILGYSYAKRFTCAAHYILGLALALAPAGAWIAAADSFDPRILSLSGALFFSIAAFDIIYALQDIDFDRRENLHSIPAALGKTARLSLREFPLRRPRPSFLRRARCSAWGAATSCAPQLLPYCIFWEFAQSYLAATPS